MKNMIAVAAMVILVSSCLLKAEDRVKFESSIGAGAIVSDNANVSPSSVVKGDAGWQLGKFLKIGAQVGQALHFNEKDQVFSVVNGKQSNGGGVYSPNGAAHFQNDEDVFITENNTTNVTVNIINTPVPAPVLQNLSEESYFYGEPYLGINLELLDFLSIYGKGAFGAARMTVQDGSKDNGTSYSYGGGIQITMNDISHLFFGHPAGIFIKSEALYRKIEVNRTGYDGNEFTGVIGISF